jgi:hypothetical protein
MNGRLIASRQENQRNLLILNGRLFGGDVRQLQQAVRMSARPPFFDVGVKVLSFWRRLSHTKPLSWIPTRRDGENLASRLKVKNRFFNLHVLNMASTKDNEKCKKWEIKGRKLNILLFQI